MTTNRAALSSTELVRLASANDQAAWQEIVRRYHGLVHARVRLFRLQDADAHDAVQMTWLRLMENCQRIQYPEYLGSWLATTASRECLAILRGIARTKNQDGMAIDNVADPTASPEQRVIDKHTTQILHDLVAELAPREQSSGADAILRPATFLRRTRPHDRNSSRQPRSYTRPSPPETPPKAQNLATLSSMIGSRNRSTSACRKVDGEVVQYPRSTFSAAVILPPASEQPKARPRAAAARVPIAKSEPRPGGAAGGYDRTRRAEQTVGGKLQAW